MRKIAFAAFLLLSAYSTAQAFPDGTIQIANVSAKTHRIPLKIKDPELAKDLVEMGGGFNYEITFGKITQAQFNGLKTYFRKVEPLAFDANRSYTIVDFLPAKMQALLGLRFEMVTRDAADLNDINLFYKSDGQAYSALNCWGTAWNMVNDPTAATPMITFMGSRAHTQNMLQDQKFSDAVKPENAQFGDVLLLKAKIDGVVKLEHAAVYLGYGFYFEKTDSSSAMFFRLVQFDDLKARMAGAFNSIVDDNGKPAKVPISFELRRFGGTGKAKLPLPQDVFAASKTTDASEKEYGDALPKTEKAEMMNIFIDDRMGGGDQADVVDMKSVKFRLNPQTGRGELDPSGSEFSRFKKADQ